MEAAGLMVWMVQHCNMGLKKKKKRNYDLLGPGPKFKIQVEDLMIINFAQMPPTQQVRRNQEIPGQVHFPPVFTFLVSALGTKITAHIVLVLYS